MTDTRIVALARTRVGAGLHVAPGSMADDLGHLAVGVITLDMDNHELWLVMKAARDHVESKCDGGSRCGFGQHYGSCATVTTFEALKRAVDGCPARADVREDR